jgi:hypothetical protein
MKSASPTPKRRLLVDMTELATALDEPEAGPTRAFLDLESGEIEYIPRELEVEGVYDDIFAAPERWIEIRPAPSWERHRVRSRFADQVADPHVRLLLIEALEGRAAFARFAQVLRRWPDIREQWFRFRDGALAALGKQYLEEIGVDPVAPPRQIPS